MRKKKIIIGIGSVVIIALAGWNFTQRTNTTQMSQITLANIEALASGESGTQYQACKGTEYVWGALKRVRNSSGRCEFRNLIDVTLDGYCY